MLKKEADLNVQLLLCICTVMNMTIATQRLAKRVPERYAVNSRGTSVAG
jgi:hypothetical protein